MSEHQLIERADQSRVTTILSRCMSRTQPCLEAEPFEPFSHTKLEKMSFPTPWLQEVEWECYDGVYGPRTLLKEVDHDTASCPECGGEGWKDERGDTICRECGLVLNDTPQMIPRDYGTKNHHGGPTAGSARNVFFNDGTGSKALNQNVDAQPSEPDVQ